MGAADACPPEPGAAPANGVPLRCPLPRPLQIPSVSEDVGQFAANALEEYLKEAEQTRHELVIHFELARHYYLNDKFTEVSPVAPRASPPTPAGGTVSGCAACPCTLATATVVCQELRGMGDCAV